MGGVGCAAETEREIWAFEDSEVEGEGLKKGDEWGVRKGMVVGGACDGAGQGEVPDRGEGLGGWRNCWPGRRGDCRD